MKYIATEGDWAVRSSLFNAGATIFADIHASGVGVIAKERDAIIVVEAVADLEPWYSSPPAFIAWFCGELASGKGTAPLVAFSFAAGIVKVFAANSSAAYGRFAVNWVGRAQSVVAAAVAVLLFGESTGFGSGEVIEFFDGELSAGHVDI